jgi:1-acyl-sn-glycerol-3-phosphate acyltransferase
MSSGAPGDDFRVMPPEQMWSLARVIIQTWFAPMMRLRVYGADRVPPAGPAVVASNHIAGDDPIVLGMATSRSIRYMAKIELWRIPVLRTVIPHTGAFPVDRGNADRQTIQNARAVLRSGHLLGIFVEGTRQSTDEIGAARTGAAMCAVLEEARIIPACLIGTDHHRRNPFHQAAVAWGTPIDVSGVPRGAKGYRAIAQALEEELRELRLFLYSAQRAGFPRDAVPPVSRATVEV